MISDLIFDLISDLISDLQLPNLSSLFFLPFPALVMFFYLCFAFVLPFVLPLVCLLNFCARSFSAQHAPLYVLILLILTFTYVFL